VVWTLELNSWWVWSAECCSPKGKWRELDTRWHRFEQLWQVGDMACLMLVNFINKLGDCILITEPFIMYMAHRKDGNENFWPTLWDGDSVLVRAEKKLLTVLFPDGRAFTLKVHFLWSPTLYMYLLEAGFCFVLDNLANTYSFQRYWCYQILPPPQVHVQ
jgi:hypothetical protein